MTPACWLSVSDVSRLIYSWVMFDQDISLLHDTAPLFSVTEFGAPIPDSDVLWQAKTAAEWSTLFEQVHEFSGGYSSVGSGARLLSLRDLFRRFQDDTIVSQGIELTALHLRLLLHPLQGLVCQFRQLQSCFPDAGVATPPDSNSVSAAGTQARLAELQSMLQRWWALYQRLVTNNSAEAMSPMMQAALVIFHLISLNTVTDFPLIERMARSEDIDGSYASICWAHKRAISDIEKVVFHCDQILMLARTMPRGVTPPWLPGAIYRVALILWAETLVRKEMPSPTSGFFPTDGSNFTVDAVAPEHTVMHRFLSKQDGVRTLTKYDGTHFELDNPFAVLRHCVDVIEDTVNTRFADGICKKLMKVATTSL